MGIRSEAGTWESFLSTQEQKMSLCVWGGGGDV